MIRFVAIIGLCGLISACAGSPRSTQQPYYPPDQGRYVYPDYLRPADLPLIPPTDACQSQLYQGLIGQSEGSIFIPGLPGSKRVLKPAFDEGFEYAADEPLGQGYTMVEVRDYLPDQTLYVPSIRTPAELLALNDYRTDRLTIELDEDGVIQEIRCG